MVPTFTMHRLTGEVPSFAPAVSPRVRRRPSPWPPHQHSEPASESTTHKWWSCTADRPVSTRLEPASRLRSFPRWFKTAFTPSRLTCRTRVVWRCRPVPALSGLLPPSPASPGSGCPQLQRPAATGPRWSPFTSTRYMAPRGAPEHCNRTPLRNECEGAPNGMHVRVQLGVDRAVGLGAVVPRLDGATPGEDDAASRYRFCRRAPPPWCPATPPGRPPAGAGGTYRWTDPVTERPGYGLGCSGATETVLAVGMGGRTRRPGVLMHAGCDGRGTGRAATEQPPLDVSGQIALGLTSGHAVALRRAVVAADRRRVCTLMCPWTSRSDHAMGSDCVARMPAAAAPERPH